MKTKNFVWMVGGFSAVAVGFLVWGARRGERVQQLAHKLEEAWADQHTIA